MTRAVAAHPVACLAVALTLLTAGCSDDGDALPTPSPTPSAPAAPTVIAPAQQPGLDGTSGLPAPNLCTRLDARALGRTLGATVAARPSSWNDAGVPSLDLCAFTLTRTGGAVQTVHVGVSALAAQPASLDRLAQTLGSEPQSAPEIGPNAEFGRLGAAFITADRAVRVTAEPELVREDAAAIAIALAPLVPKTLKSARITDATCQPVTAMAERFLGAAPQLRRDYRARGGLTCIWGTTDRTVAIVESLTPVRDPIPEADHDPPPARAPVGTEGYFLPRNGQLVFRRGPRVVRVSALADPATPVELDTLIDIVQPIMPLFLR